MAINLDYYRTFYYVAVYSSISRAAEELYISQPAVSKAIRILESELKCTLFVRSSHGTTLTDDGQQLFEYVSRAFNELSSGVKSVSRNEIYESQDIYIGATESSLYSVLLPKLGIFKKEYPNVHFHISGCSTKELIDMLNDGSIDLAMGVTPVTKQTAFPIIELADVYDVVFAHIDYPINDDVPLTIEQICSQPIVGVGPNTSAGKHISDFFSEYGCSYTPAFTVETSSQVCHFVENQLGIGIAPQWTLVQYKSSNLKKLETAFSIPKRKIFLAINNKYPISPLCHQFINLIQTGMSSIDS